MTLLLTIIFELVKIISIILPVMLSVAYTTLVERKILASVQKREGPNKVGFFGLLQPLADGLKLILKETLYPSHSIKIPFLIAPIFIFVVSLLGWMVIPLSESGPIADINIGLLYLFVISSFSVYGLLIAGWCSNSKYPFLGALRSVAQMIAYDVSLGLIILSIVISAGSLNLMVIVQCQETVWFILPHFPAFFLFIMTALAETCRTPFDLPEAEPELVGGYNTEYSSMMFALFFLGEYVSIVLMSSLAVILFFGGWLAPFPFLNFIPGFIWFALKVFFVICFFILTRGAYPRYRYDQLMSLGWKYFLPMSLGWLIWTCGLLFSLGYLP